MEIIIILGFLLFISLSMLSVLSIKVKALKNNVKKLSSAYSRIENLMSSKTKLDNDAHQESFIKFLSDSRDSAFEYIEEVQNGLSKFVGDVDADIMAMEPNYNSLKNISKSYDDLIKLLPRKDI
jgi:DNA repair ATPase RecN